MVRGQFFQQLENKTVGAHNMASPAGDTDVALKAEAHRLRVDNAFLAEELCSTAQQVIEVSAGLRRARAPDLR